MRIDSKLVYIKAKGLHPKIDKIIDVTMDGVSDADKVTYVNAMQDKILKYERGDYDGMEYRSFDGVSRHYLEMESGGKMYVDEFSYGVSRTRKRNENTGRKKTIHLEDNKVLKNCKDGTRNRRLSDDIWNNGRGHSEDGGDTR